MPTRKATVRAPLPATEAPLPVLVSRVVTRRQPARTLTGRSEEQDAGTRAVVAHHQAHVTAQRPAFDRFDAIAKPREAAGHLAEATAFMAPPLDAVILAGGEGMVKDTGPGNGLSVAQNSREIDLIDTLENPSMIGLGASHQRLEALQRLGLVQSGMDLAQTVNASNSIEKMACHQLAALHFAAMRLLGHAVGAGQLREPDDVLALRLTNAATRLIETYQSGMLALLKFKTGGKQTVVVQHNHIADGGQAVIAGSVTKTGASGTGGGESK